MFGVIMNLHQPLEGIYTMGKTNQLPSSQDIIDFLNESDDMAVCMWDENLKEWVPVPVVTLLRKMKES